MKKNTKSRNGRNGSVSDRPLTEGRFAYFVKDLREQIKSTAKGTETILREEIQKETRKICERVERTEIAITEHTRQIKALDVKIDNFRTELKEEIQGVRIELKEEIQGVRIELKEEIQGVRIELKEEIQGVRIELKEEIQGVRTELKEEIQGVCTGLNGLKEEMQKMEGRLSDKIDGHASRLDDHESRISVLESADLNSSTAPLFCRHTGSVKP